MKPNCIEIVTVKGKHLRWVDIDSIDWQSIAYVDYIAVEYDGQVAHEFELAYGSQEFNAMQKIVDQYVNDRNGKIASIFTPDIKTQTPKLQIDPRRRLFGLSHVKHHTKD